MTSDGHCRLYASGKPKNLPAYRDWIIYPANAAAEEKAQAEREFRKYNQRVSELLRRKGFLEPPARKSLRKKFFDGL